MHYKFSIFEGVWVPAFEVLVEELTKKNEVGFKVLPKHIDIVRMELNLFYILYLDKRDEQKQSRLARPMYQLLYPEMELKDVVKIYQSGGRLTRSRKNQPAPISPKGMESRSR